MMLQVFGQNHCQGHGIRYRGSYTYLSNCETAALGSLKADGIDRKEASQHFTSNIIRFKINNNQNCNIFFSLMSLRFYNKFFFPHFSCIKLKNSLSKR